MDTFSLSILGIEYFITRKFQGQLEPGDTFVFTRNKDDISRIERNIY